jgi:hypothetical protein
MKPLAVSGTDGLGSLTSTGTLIGVGLVLAAAWLVYQKG